MERFGIYGGTFSPIHKGHIKSALEFFHGMSLDRLLIIPSAKPPHKSEVAGATAEDRLNMARLAFSDSHEYENGKILVSDYEIEKGDKSYTVHTLEHFKCEGRQVFLLMGTDMFVTLDTWYRAEDIFALSDIVLIRRESDSASLSLIESKNAEYIEKYSARTHFIESSPLVISSTALREMIKKGEDVSEFIPKEVNGYISENNLYR